MQTILSNFFLRYSQMPFTKNAPCPTWPSPARSSFAAACILKPKCKSPYDILTIKLSSSTSFFNTSCNCKDISPSSLWDACKNILALNSQLGTQLTLWDHGHRLVHCMACLFTPQLLLVLIGLPTEGWPRWVYLGGWFCTEMDYPP